MRIIAVSAVLGIVLGCAQQLTAQAPPPPPPLGPIPLPPLDTEPLPPLDTEPLPPLDPVPPPADEPPAEEPPVEDAPKNRGKRTRVRRFHKVGRFLRGREGEAHVGRFCKTLEEREASRAHMKRIRDLIRAMKRRHRK